MNDVVDYNLFSFFEFFFPEGFNKKYDDFLHFDKICLDSIKAESLEVLRLHDEEIYDSLSKAKNMDDVAAIKAYHSSNPPEGFISASPKTKVVEYNNDADVMIIEVSDYIYLPEEDSYCKIKSKQYTRNFLDELKTLLYSELEKAIDITVNAIMQMNTVNAQENFIHKLFLTATYIINNKITSISNSKYIPHCQRFLIDYIQEIENRFPDYVSRDESTYKQFLAPKKEEIRSLNMIKKRNQLPFLLEKLKKKDFWKTFYL